MRGKYKLVSLVTVLALVITGTYVSNAYAGNGTCDMTRDKDYIDAPNHQYCTITENDLRSTIHDVSEVNPVVVSNESQELDREQLCQRLMDCDREQLCQRLKECNQEQLWLFLNECNQDCEQDCIHEQLRQRLRECDCEFQNNCDEVRLRLRQHATDEND